MGTGERELMGRVPWCLGCGEGDPAYCAGCEKRAWKNSLALLGRIEGLENDVTAWMAGHEVLRRAMEAIRYHCEYVAPDPDVVRVAEKALGGMPRHFCIPVQVEPDEL